MATNKLHHHGRRFHCFGLRHFYLFTARLLGFVSVAILLLFQSSSWGCEWVLPSDQTGGWSTSANWGGLEPTSDSIAYIYNGGTAIVTQPDEACLYLYLGNSGAGHSGAVQLESGFLSASKVYIGNYNTGLFTQLGGTNTISGNLYLGYNTGSNGTYNLNGGTLVLHSISKGSGIAAFNFGGGTLQANSNFSTTLPMTLTGNGGNANVDTAGYTVTYSGQLSGSGGLNKLGSGNLSLTGINTYTGGTNINVGNLSISSTAALPGWDTPGKYTVASGAPCWQSETA